MKVKGKVAAKTGNRIGHGTVVPLPVFSDSELPPRGWIHPSGKFLETQQHWETISAQLRIKVRKKPGARGVGADDPTRGEKDAHVAYAQGWISIGHGGAFNAIGHEDTFKSPDHPAVQTLRKLVTKIPHFSLRVEKQMGEIDPATGKHVDFDVTEYDLKIFIRRGTLRKA